jgi:hypothetical protein
LIDANHFTLPLIASASASAAASVTYWNILNSVSISLSPGKGGLLVANSTMMHPTAHMSTGAE